MAGLENLVSMRGPQIYSSHFGWEILEDIRSSLVREIKAIPVGQI